MKMERTRQKRYAIIVAGGSGTRFGSTLPKQFCDLCGKPILMHTIEKFVSADAEVTLVLPESHISLWQELCIAKNFHVAHNVVEGGETRYHSVKHGLQALHASGDDLIAIHDGVRPLVSPRLIEDAYHAADIGGSAIPVIPVSDSIRQVHSAGSSRQLPRSELRAVQTPQVFQYRLLRDAYNQEFSPLFTDDASVVESLGIEINLIEGDTNNIKITHPIDIFLAEQILKVR